MHQAIAFSTPPEAATWQDGAPLSIPSDAVLTDILSYRRLTCPGCHKRGMKTMPQHTTAGGYRILASCRNCRQRVEC